MTTAMQEVRKQYITGVVPPQSGEALIREAWPSIASHPAIARTGRILIQSIAGAPLGWLVMIPFYFLKILPFVATRYTVTNRRVMIRRGLKPKATHEVSLSEINDVRIQKDSNSEFFRAGDLQIISNDKVVLVLAGVPEPESFRFCIINAYKAWVPGRADGPIVPAKAPTAS